MPNTRSILARLSRDELLGVLDAYELDVPDRRVKDWAGSNTASVILSASLFLLAEALMMSRGFRSVVLALVFSASLPAAALAQVQVVSCPEDGTFGDSLKRGFYVGSFGANALSP